MSGAPVVIGWPVAVPTGWGVFGRQLALAALRAGDLPLPLFGMDGPGWTAQDHAAMAAAMRLRAQHARLWELYGPGPLDLPLLMPLLDHLVVPAGLVAWEGAPEIGLTFLETAVLDPASRARLEAMPLIIAGAAWVADVLRSWGFDHVAVAPQGVDPTLFHPQPRGSMFGPGPVVFSGGKLEFRKAQDVVAKAFRLILHRHPEARLVTAWHNDLPASVASMTAAGVPPVPAAPEGWDVPAWLEEFGIPRARVTALGPLPHVAFPEILASCDVALFPNRCEGGTNLVAMECLAAGLPTVLSACTGHLDLLSDGAGWAVPVAHTLSGAGQAAWGAVDPEAAAAMVCAVLEDGQARAKAADHAAVMASKWSWAVRADHIWALLGEVLR